MKTTSERIEEKINSNYTNYMKLPKQYDNQWLKLNRVTKDSWGKNVTFVDVILYDKVTENERKLATYNFGKWSFKSPMDESLFWKHVKNNPIRFRAIFNRVRKPIKLTEISPFTVSLKFRLKQLKRFFNLNF